MYFLTILALCSDLFFAFVLDKIVLSVIAGLCAVFVFLFVYRMVLNFMLRKR